MAGEGGAAFLPIAGDHIDHARRQMLLADLGDQQHRQRRILRRLQHDGVAGADRWGDLQRRELGRCVPGHDGARDADGFAARVAQHAFAEGNGEPLQFAREAAEISERIRHHPRFAARLRAQRVAGFRRDGAGEFLEPCLQRFPDACEQASPLAGGNARPGGECGGGRLDGPVHILGARAGHLADGRAARGIFDRDRFPGSRCLPGTADQHGTSLEGDCGRGGGVM